MSVKKIKNYSGNLKKNEVEKFKKMRWHWLRTLTKEDIASTNPFLCTYRDKYDRCECTWFPGKMYFMNPRMEID